MAEAEKQAGSSRAKLGLAAVVVLVLGSWTAIFITGWVKWGNGTDTRGQFGDSFGILGGLFAGLAFIAACVAGYFQWVAMRDEQTAAAENAVESRFFQLLNSLQSTLNEMRQGDNVGRQATRKIAVWLLEDLRPCRTLDAGISDQARHANIQEWFELFHEGKDCQGAIRSAVAPAADLLGQVFRLIYHILKYVNSSNDITREDKRSYAALLRAHLSNPELAMLFYNSMTPHGFKRAFPLLAGYRMFKNMKPSSLVDPDGDWKLYLNLIEQRRDDIKAIVGEVPNSQRDV
jgi:hypothetical protein